MLLSFELISFNFLSDTFVQVTHWGQTMQYMEFMQDLLRIALVLYGYAYPPDLQAAWKSRGIVRQQLFYCILLLIPLLLSGWLTCCFINERQSFLISIVIINNENLRHLDASLNYLFMNIMYIAVWNIMPYFHMLGLSINRSPKFYHMTLVFTILWSHGKQWLTGFFSNEFGTPTTASHWCLTEVFITN